jgi:hypothetical protein
MNFLHLPRVLHNIIQGPVQLNCYMFWISRREDEFKLSDGMCLLRVVSSNIRQVCHTAVCNGREDSEEQIKIRRKRRVRKKEKTGKETERNGGRSPRTICSSRLVHEIISTPAESTPILRIFAVFLSPTLRMFS